MKDILRHSSKDIHWDNNNPFQNDSLGRGKFASLLTSIAEKYSDGFVMAINGEWGTGKTVFINRWKDLLKTKGFKVTIFNAWENDYFGEPTLSLLSQFREFFYEDKSISDKAYAIWETIRNVPSSLLKGFAHKSVYKLIPEESIQEIKDKYKENLRKDIDYQDSDITRYVSQRNEFLKFRESLKALTSELAKDEKPLIFIIDELDRCTPSFAVEVLEKVKHLFNIPNIVFCFAVDKQHLVKSIQGHYGSFNFNGEEYLRRFFDVELEIPSFDPYTFSQILTQHFEISNFIKSEEDQHEFHRLVAETAIKKNLNLRQIVKFFTHLKLMYSLYTIDSSEWIVGFMVLLYKFSNKEFEEIKNRNLSLGDYAIKLKPFFDFSENGKGAPYMGRLLFHIDKYIASSTQGGICNDNTLFPGGIPLFTESEIDTVYACYKAEQQKHLHSSALFKLISKILFLEQHIAKP